MSHPINSLRVKFFELDESHSPRHQLSNQGRNSLLLTAWSKKKRIYGLTIKFSIFKWSLKWKCVGPLLSLGIEGLCEGVTTNIHCSSGWIFLISIYILIMNILFVNILVSLNDKVHHSNLWSTFFVVVSLAKEGVIGYTYIHVLIICSSFIFYLLFFHLIFLFVKLNRCHRPSNKASHSHPRTLSA